MKVKIYLVQLFSVISDIYTHIISIYLKSVLLTRLPSLSVATSVFSHSEGIHLLHSQLHFSLSYQDIERQSHCS